jgi:hypothetical protein
MCRIFYNPSPSVTFKSDDIWKFLLFLETIGGRDGNGVYCFKNNKLYRSHERMPIEAKLKGSFLFHTRLATHGKKETYNCQPFVGNRYIMVHNGVFYDVRRYAHLLGFPIYSGKKYSDSYMMHWIMERKGLFHFYNTFRDKSYGVIVVYDRELKQTFLLKTSGVFESAKLEQSGKYIYGSVELDYWKLAEEPETFGCGLWRINEDEIVQLDKISSSSDYHGRWHGKEYDSKTRTWVKKKKKKKKRRPTVKVVGRERLCAYCWKAVPEKESLYDDRGYKICGICKDTYVNDDEDIRGINNLFEVKIPKWCIGCKYVNHDRNDCEIGDRTFECGISKTTGMGTCYVPTISSPKECFGCNWLHSGDCWFGGIKQTVYFYKHKDCTSKTGSILCNTNSPDTFFVTITCDECNIELDSDGKWKIHNDKITCFECIDEDKKIDIIGNEEDEPPKECGNCHFEYTSSLEEPCHSCIKDESESENWVEKEPHETDEFYIRCAYCGFYFTDDDVEPLEDRWGNYVCMECEDFDVRRLGNPIPIKDYKKMLRDERF